MSFTKNKYEVVKKAISNELANFCYMYFCNKRKVTQHLHDNKFISPFDTTWGTWKDEQVPNTYSHYADLVMETLLERVLPKMIKVTNLNLIPTYSYARIYKFGDVLHRHKDRSSCEISCTLNLGGDEWPIYLDPTGDQGKEGKKITLKPGDMLAYSGCDLEHWRESFEGKDCCQVFLHYNSTHGALEEPNLFDTRPFLGLPVEFKKTMNDLNEKFNFLKSKKYEKSNHPGVEVFYDKQTFLKINKKTKITITPGNVLFIIKKSFGLKEGALKVIKESELHNETNSNMYCVLTDCLFSEKETDSKIFIRSGDSEKALI